MTDSSQNGFIKRIEDLSERAFRSNQLTHTLFLNPAEVAAARVFLQTHKGAEAYFYGGYAACERMRLFFLPDYIDRESFAFDEHISAIKISCPFSTLTHRDYLGSLIGLGIRREALGDILVFPQYAYILCTSQIAGFILENVTKIGRYGAKCTPCSLDEIEVPTPEFAVVSQTVSSLRTDAITALAFGISRTSAAELISQGALSVNHLEETSTSATLSVGDIVSLRGFGRAKLESLGGKSKKGRQFITLHVFSKK